MSENITLNYRYYILLSLHLNEVIIFTRIFGIDENDRVGYWIENSQRLNPVGNKNDEESQGADEKLKGMDKKLEFSFQYQLLHDLFQRQ